MGPDLLISDLHLSQERPLITDRLFEFLTDEAPTATALYILGDLFDYWVGDDELRTPSGDPIAGQVVSALHALAQGGTALYVMQGNRDFLLGSDFFSACGALPLADVTVHYMDMRAAGKRYDEFYEQAKEIKGDAADVDRITNHVLGDACTPGNAKECTFDTVRPVVEHCLTGDLDDLLS